MKPENIKTRISIGKTERGDIGFIYDYNLLKNLNVIPDLTFKNYYFLEKGSVFELNRSKYRIVEVRPFFYNESIDMTNPPGVNYLGIGDLLNFNFEIAIFVEEIR